MTFNKQGKERIIITVGFLLILVVAISTFQRGQNKDSQKENAGAEIENKFDYPLIFPSELQKKIIAKENLKIIDLRGQNEFANGHIPYSVNIPIENISRAKINNNDEIILVGSDKMDYLSVVEFLKNKNYGEAFVLLGGFEEWKNTRGQIISFGDPQLFVDQSKITYLAPEELKKLLDANETVFILDTRSSQSFTSGHLPGAVNIPFSELEQRDKELPAIAEIAVYGDSELSGFQAGTLLYDLNFFNAYVLQGGLEAWKAKGFEIVK